MILEDVINELKKEKLELRRVSDDQQKRIIDMSRTISHLKLTNKNLEEEKSSLMTAIRLVQNDYSQLSIKMSEREVEKASPLHGRFQSRELEAKLHPPKLKIETFLTQAISLHYLVNLKPIHSNHRCHQQMALNKVNKQGNKAQLRVQIKGLQLPIC